MSNGIEIRDKILRIFFNRGSGREIKKYIQSGIRERVDMKLEFREGDSKNSFNFSFNSLNSSNNIFIMSGKDFEFKKRRVRESDIRLVLGWEMVEEIGNSFSINFISFSLVKGDFREVANYVRIDDVDIKIMRGEEGEEREIISRSGFHTNNRVMWIGKGVNEGEEILEILIRLLKRFDREGIRVNRFNSDGKRIFGDINTDKIREVDVVHREPPLKLGLNKKGEASKSILQSDAGLYAQSTYEDLRKRWPDSFWGLEAQGNFRPSLPFLFFLNLLISFSYLNKIYKI